MNTALDTRIAALEARVQRLEAMFPPPVSGPTPDPVPPPPPVPPTAPVPLPAPMVRDLDLSPALPGGPRTLRLKSLAEAARAAASEEPGTVLVIADGASKGDVEIRGDVVVRPESPLGVRHVGRIALAQAVLCGVDLQGEVELGRKGQLWRSRIHDTDSKGAAISIKGEHATAARNLLENIGKWGIRVDGSPKKPALFAVIRGNHLRRFLGRTSRQHVNAHEGIQLGLTNAHTKTALKALVEWNLFEDVSVDSEFISIKSCDNVVRFNTALGCQAHITNRHGRRNQILANWLESCLGIALQDADGICADNQLHACPHGIRLMAGDVIPEKWDGKVKGHPACQGWIVARNKGQVASFAFEGKQIAASRIDRTGAQVPVLAARRLSAADVGPLSIGKAA